MTKPKVFYQAEITHADGSVNSQCVHADANTTDTPKRQKDKDSIERPSQENNSRITSNVAASTKKQASIIVVFCLREEKTLREQ